MMMVMMVCYRRDSLRSSIYVRSESDCAESTSSTMRQSFFLAIMMMMVVMVSMTVMMVMMRLMPNFHSLPSLGACRCVTSISDFIIIFRLSSFLISRCTSDAISHVVEISSLKSVTSIN